MYNKSVATPEQIEREQFIATNIAQSRVVVALSSKYWDIYEKCRSDEDVHNQILRVEYTVQDLINELGNKVPIDVIKTVLLGLQTNTHLVITTQKEDFSNLIMPESRITFAPYNPISTEMVEVAQRWIHLEQ